MNAHKYKANWFPQIQTSQYENVNKNSYGVSSAVVNINKYEFSKCNRMAEIHFNSEDLEFFETQIGGCMDILKFNKFLNCPYCDIVAREAIVFQSDCNCRNNHFVCKSCWKSECPKCKARIVEIPTEFHPVDVIRDAFTLFTIETALTVDPERILNAIAELLRKIELEIMCNFCNSYLKNATLVKVNFAEFPEQKSVQCCGGECEDLFKKCYGNHGNSIPLELFDGACAEILKLLNVLITYCEEKHGSELGSPSEPMGRECMLMYHGHTAEKLK